jgi:hypothetical protein
MGFLVHELTVTHLVAQFFGGDLALFHGEHGVVGRAAKVLADGLTISGDNSYFHN